MSFLNISDPNKRDLIVKEFHKLKKNIQDNLLSERTGERQLETDLSKFYRPITETQKATAREITEGLKPIKEGIENIPQAITFPPTQSIGKEASKDHLKILVIQRTIIYIEKIHILVIQRSEYVKKKKVFIISVASKLLSLMTIF